MDILGIHKKISREKINDVAKEIDEILDENGLKIVAILQASPDGIVPRWGIVEKQNGKIKTN